MPVETVPDDPIVELPVKVVCSVCNVIMREDVARWPKSHVDMARRNPSWTGVVISHSYCPEHNPSRSEPQIQGQEQS